MSIKIIEAVREKHSWLFEGVQETINTKISPNDGMYQNQEEYYYICGLWAVQCIRNAMQIEHKNENDIKDILDFASGFGRVTRILNAVFPKANITVCDTDKQGIDFISSSLRAHGIYGNVNLSKVKFEKKFDLIWCGSLFTHIESSYWNDVLNFLSENLNPNGLMVFTTHGRYVANRISSRSKTYGLTEDEIIKLMNNYTNDDFAFGNYDYAKNYGVSISKPSWVIKEIESVNNIELVSFTERGWVKHQDVVACRKIVY